MLLEIDDGLYRCRLFGCGDIDEVAVSEFIVFDNEIFYTGRIDRCIMTLIPPGRVLPSTEALIRAAHFDRIDFLRILFYPESDSMPMA